MSALFKPFQIREVNFKNHIAVSPMCQYSSEDGFANDWHLVHLGSRAVGGAALVLFEASAVSPEGRITPGDLGIWKDAHIEGLSRIVKFIAQQNSVAGIQLAHAGRKASVSRPWEGGRALSENEGGWTTRAPSKIPFRESDPAPAALSIEDIREVVSDFKKAAVRALKSGFKVIEIHSAHGYLLHEFLSPLSNHRTDNYGGSFDNRIHFLLEIVEAIREVWPQEYPLFVRISATDWVEGGWGINDSVMLAEKLKSRGVDLIDCSSGGNVPDAKIPAGPGYQVGFSERIKKETGVFTGAVGIITTAEEAERIIETGKADMVLLARQFLRDPYFPLHAAKKLGADSEWPLQYERAKSH